MSTIIVKLANSGADAATSSGAPAVRSIGGRPMRALSNNEVQNIANTEITIEADLSKKDRAELEDSDEHLLAEEIPLKLVGPIPSDPSGITTEAADAGQVSWGIRATGAENSTYDGRGIRVAVLDTGIDKDHPAFSDPALSITTANFTNDVPEDTDGHGTHCAGTIFGRDVNDTRIGVARGINEAFIAKVIPAGSSALVSALNWAYDNKCHVASMSLGFDFPRFVHQETLRGVPFMAAVSSGLTQYRNNIAVLDALMDLYRARELQAGEHGMIVVAASGNESNRSNFTIASAPPSAAMGIISVGAISQNSGGSFNVAPFSNTGPDVVAPGVNVLSARAQLGDLVSMNGTSMACPHVAGIAALYFQRAIQGLGAAPNAGGVAAEIKVLARKIGLTLSDGGSGLAVAPK